MRDMYEPPVETGKSMVAEGHRGLKVPVSSAASTVLSVALWPPGFLPCHRQEFQQQQWQQHNSRGLSGKCLMYEL